MSDYKETTYIEGDVSIGEDVHIGGNVTQQGDSLIKGNVRIKGWLEAENIKDTNKGFYLTKEQLKARFDKQIADAKADMQKNKSKADKPCCK